MSRSLKFTCLQSLFLCLILSNCSPPSSTNSERVFSQFDHPQALRLLDDELIVLNSAYDAPNWGPGFINVIDQEHPDQTILINTHAANPQNLHFKSGWMMVVESGIYDFSDFDNPRSEPPFGVELFSDRGDDFTAHSFVQLPQTIDDYAISAPVNLQTIGSVTLITSGLFNIVWRIKWSNIESGIIETVDVLKLETELSTGLGNIVVWNNHFILTEFNHDRLYLIDEDADEVKCRIDLGTNPEEMEGLQTPLIIDEHLWVSFAFSGHVEKVELAPLVNECRSVTTTLPATLGQIPNDLDRVNDEVWVTMSGENHLLRLDLASGEIIGQIVLPLGSNPWSFDFNQNLQVGAISLWAVDEVHVLDHEGQLQFRMNEEIQRNESDQTKTDDTP